MNFTRYRTALSAVLVVLGCGSSHNEAGPSSPGVGGAVGSGGAAAGASVVAEGGAAGAPISGPPTAGSAGASAEPVQKSGCGMTPTLTSGDGLAISVSGSSRTYNLKVPDDYDNSRPYRLIISYHPGDHTADQISGTSMGAPFYGLWDLAEGSTIFVAPQGLGNQWANPRGADVEFSRQLIALIESEFCVDKSRIFCEGFSVGGSMSYAMACAMGDVVRGIAVHSGGPMSGCVKHDKPVAYFMTHGTNDSELTYPWNGVPELQDFAKTNGCTSPDPTLSKNTFVTTMPTPTDSSGETPVCVDFTGCKAGYPARACIFVGDHTPAPGGTTSWVPVETWKFISQF